MELVGLIIMASHCKWNPGDKTNVYTNEHGKPLENPRPVRVMKESSYDEYKQGHANSPSPENMREMGYQYFYEVLLLEVQKSMTVTFQAQIDEGSVGNTREYTRDQLALMRDIFDKFVVEIQKYGYVRSQMYVNKANWDGGEIIR